MKSQPIINQMWYVTYIKWIRYSVNIVALAEEMLMFVKESCNVENCNKMKLDEEISTNSNNWNMLMLSDGRCERFITITVVVDVCFWFTVEYDVNAARSVPLHQTTATRVKGFFKAPWRFPDLASIHRTQSLHLSNHNSLSDWTINKIIPDWTWTDLLSPLMYCWTSWWRQNLFFFLVKSQKCNWLCLFSPCEHVLLNENILQL